MHMRGTPASMQEAPEYVDVVAGRARLPDVARRGLRSGGHRARAHRDRPGLRLRQDEGAQPGLLARLGDIAALGYPVLAGLSRKSTLGAITGRPEEGRVAASVAAALIAVERGASILRVHDVQETVDALKVLHAVIHAGDIATKGEAMIRKLASGGTASIRARSTRRPASAATSARSGRARRPSGTSERSSSSSGADDLGAHNRASRRGGLSGMKREYFGTDGVRGRVGEAPITPELVMKLGWAAGRTFAADARRPAGRPAVLIGKDTRISGYLLEAALEAGTLGGRRRRRAVRPLPTPGIAYLTLAQRLTAGIVISASHNPYDDNGIKFFSSSGAKLPDATEVAIEAAMAAPLACVASAELGKARRVPDAAGRYVEFCKATFPSTLDLRGVKLVVDCANGAGYHVAPPVFSELGATVVPIGVAPDGLNINAGCGATHPQHLAAEVVKHRADLGVALDGDGDRLVMADRDGRIYHGDELLYVIAMDAKRRGALDGGVVGTVMSNLGFEQALARAGVPLERAKVGDRYVLERMAERGWSLGGENSGHLICLDKHTTGDAIVAALAVLRALIESGRRSRRRPRPSRCSRRRSSTCRSGAAGTGRAATRSGARATTRSARSARRDACCCVRRAPSRCCA
jgi:phosphoglucosamine mutase